MSIFVLTRSHNAYDQFGAYFVCAWPSKPTAKQIDEALANDDEAHFSSATEELVEHILNGGGRRKYPGSTTWMDGVWYNLVEWKQEGGAK